jgi:hypothetical protein
LAQISRSDGSLPALPQVDEWLHFSHLERIKHLNHPCSLLADNLGGAFQPL